MLRDVRIPLSLPPVEKHEALKRGVWGALEGVRVQFRTPQSVHRALSIALVESGYGSRGRSRWVEEAIVSMLDDPIHKDVWGADGNLLRHAAYKAQIIEMAYYDEPMVKDTVILSQATWRRAWRAMVEAMLYGDRLDPPEYPEVGVGDVIRVAILHRLKS